jgi:mannose-6-phosphate isomerase-like protein (cupin superfamily)
VAGYTIRNLLDVDDSAVKFGLAPDLSTRFAGGDLELEELGLSLQRLAPGYRMPFGHKHAEQEEVYVVLKGGGRFKLDDEVVAVRQWDAVRVPRETMRSYEAGPDGLELLAIGAPGTGLRDAQQVDGWWDS